MKFLSPEQVQKLLEACPPHFKPLVLLLMMTGMRLGEALRLRWADVDFEQDVVIIRNSKNGERREVPMTDTLRGTMLKLKSERRAVSSMKESSSVADDDERVFVTPGGRPYTGGRSLWETFKRATMKAGIDDLRIHDLRHHFASSLRMKGVDLLDIKEYLGHKSLSMTMRYAHVTTKRKKEVIRCLDDNFLATSAVFSGLQKEAKTG